MLLGMRTPGPTGTPPDPHPGTDLLMEDGAFFLLEDGSSTILLEV
jgi:hypothetical protein